MKNYRLRLIGESTLLMTLLGGSSLAFGQLTYYPQFSSPSTPPTTGWTSNNSPSFSGNAMVDNGQPAGASVVGTGGPQGDQEVKMTLHLVNQAGAAGTFIAYHHATSNALSGPYPAGRFYSVEIQPSFSGGQCSASMAIYKYDSGYQLLGSATVGCRDGMTVRSVYRYSQIWVYFEDGSQYSAWDGGLSGTGNLYGGVGVRSLAAGNSMTFGGVGAIETVPPPAPSVGDIAMTAFPNRVDMQWPGIVDVAGGSGMMFYQIWRGDANGNNMVDIAIVLEPTFSDATVNSSTPTTYTYKIRSADYHRNWTDSATFQVTTAPADAIDSRRTGVAPLGSYWGSQGEQIDMTSGNLNFTLPLVKAMSRNGNGVTFGLNYNSQNWRSDTRVWKLSRDTGFGYGWRMLAGSITPVYTSYWNVHHYVFTDSTGAEYPLDVNSGGVWRSTKGIYVWYDAAAKRLYFADGSFWVMGCMSDGLETDAGTLYPTIMQDSNGNRIVVRYRTGLNALPGDTSSRISQIEDVRAAGGSAPNLYTYQFSYQSLGGTQVEHLSGIAPAGISTGEWYTFSYVNSAVQTLCSPFNLYTCDANYGNAGLLASVTSSANSTSHNFEYVGVGSGYTGELSKARLPNGGYLRWTYSPFTYSGSRSQREVTGRYLCPAAVGTGACTEQSYSIGRNGGDTGTAVHSSAGLIDSGGNAEKIWWLWPITNSDPWRLGYVYSFWERRPGQNPSRTIDYTWTRDTDGNPYISEQKVTADASDVSKKATMKRTQTLDNYGNVTQSEVYNWANGATPGGLLRRWTATYLTGSNYSTRYIFNRPVTRTVSDGSTTLTTELNVYDSATGYGCYATVADVADRSLLREHDTTNYGTGFVYRGNAIYRSSPLSGTTVCATVDITGTVVDSFGTGVPETSVVSNQNLNYAVPQAIRPGADATRQTTLAFDGALNLTGETGANGESMSLNYAGSGLPYSGTSPWGASTSFDYTFFGVSGATATTKKSTTNGRWTKTTLDGLGRTIKVETGDANGVKLTTDTQYVACACSASGKVWKVSRPYAPGGTVYWTTYTYDELGRTTQVDLPAGGSNTYSYSGNTVTATDANSKVKRFESDALGQLTKVYEDPSGSNWLSSYAYDILGHLNTVTMTRPTGTQTRTFNYGNTLLLQSESHPESGTTSYTYSQGRVATKTDAKGQVFAYSYDTLGRLTTVKRFASTSDYNNNIERTAERVTYRYDANTALTGYTQYGKNRLAEVETGTGGGLIEGYSYAAAGGILGKRMRITRSAVSRDLDANYTYNNEGRRVTVQYPSVTGFPGRTYTTTYDSLARPSGMTDDQSRTWVDQVAYAGPAGQMTQIRYWVEPGAQMTETRGFTAAGQIQFQQIAGGTTLRFDYTYYNNGRLNTAQENVGGTIETLTYTYDQFNRLSGSTSNLNPAQCNLTFGYDGFGNRTTQTGTGSNCPANRSDTYTASDNHMVGASYDANGNNLMYGTTFDTDNRVVTAPNVSYAYSAKNERVYKANWTTGSITREEYYFYGMEGRRLASFVVTGSGGSWNLAPTVVDGGGVARNTNLFFAGRMIQAEGYGVVTDRLGSVRRQWSAGGVVTDRRYHPYGEERNAPYPENGGQKFATYQRDAETGLDYAMNRYYSPVTARFLSPDPYRASGGPGNPKSWNRYQYVEGDPINYYDRRGTNQQMPTFECDGSEDWLDCDWDEPNSGVGTSGSGTSPSETPSGSAGDSAAAGLAAAAKALAEIKNLKMQSPECQQVFTRLNDYAAAVKLFPNALYSGQSITASSLQAAASATLSNPDTKQMTLYNGMGSQEVWDTAKYGQLPKGLENVPNPTIGAAFALTGAYSLSQFVGTTIYVNASAMTTRPEDSLTATMMHELSHKFGLGDLQMKAALGISDKDWELWGSTAITEKFIPCTKQ